MKSSGSSSNKKLKSEISLSFEKIDDSQTNNINNIYNYYKDIVFNIIVFDLDSGFM